LIARKLFRIYQLLQSKMES